MKVLITVTRRTQYSSIVEMPEAEFQKLDAALESSDKVERHRAEEKVNRQIDVEDWQDDELHSVDDFKPFVPEGAK